MWCIIRGNLQPVIRRAELVVLLVNLNPVFMLLAMLGVPLQVFLAVSIITIVGNFLTITH